MKKFWRKPMAFILALALVASFAACANNTPEGGGSGASTATSAPEGGAEFEDVTLTVWNSEIQNQGLQTSEVAEEIKRKTGVSIEVIQGDAQKFNLLLAGGDLPDIIYTNPAQQNVAIDVLLEGEHLLELDDLIENGAPNIKSNFSNILDFSKKFLSGGRDKLYFLPVNQYKANSENPDVSYSIADIGLMTRWDVYKAIGAPEITNTDDHLDVLEQMQTHARDNDLADGKQIFAISGWSDWGLWPWWLANMREMGYRDLAINCMVAKYDTLEVDHIYRMDEFWDSLKFYNNAYNRGILDPEAFTMTSDQFWQKCSDGQVMMAYASWQSENINNSIVSLGRPQEGFEKLPKNGYPEIYGVQTPDAPLGRGSDYAHAITKNCKNPEAAIRLLDYCFSEEGARLIHSGIEGTHWENVDGVPTPTQAFLEMAKSDENYREKTGVTIYNKLSGYETTQVLSDGYPADLSKSPGEKERKLLDIDRDFCDFYGEKDGAAYQFPGQVLDELLTKGDIKSYNTYMLFASLVQQPSSDINSILQQCEQYMNVQGVKAITAASDEEFEACRTEAMLELENKGYTKAVEEVLRLYEVAKAEAETFVIE